MKLKTGKPSDHWQAQPKQMELLEACGLEEAYEGGKVKKAITRRIGYGGAAFGGKTEGLIAVGLIACMMVPGVKVGYFRRTYPELEGSDGPIERSKQLYPKIGGSYRESKHIWTFGLDEKENEEWDDSQNSALRFCHCQHEKDVYLYQSWAFDIMLFDEATHFSWYIIDYLLTRNRPSKFSTLPSPFSVMGTNPGNVGHVWFLKLFGIDPTERLFQDEQSE